MRWEFLDRESQNWLQGHAGDNDHVSSAISTSAMIGSAIDDVHGSNGHINHYDHDISPYRMHTQKIRVRMKASSTNISAVNIICNPARVFDQQNPMYQAKQSDSELRIKLAYIWREGGS
jgi:hypothetical protein